MICLAMYIRLAMHIIKEDLWHFKYAPSLSSALLIIGADLFSWIMQSVISRNRLQEVRTRLLEEIKATQKRIHPVHANTFNNSMKNKIDHAIQILHLMDRYLKLTVKDLLYLIECRIEGEKFVIHSYRWSVEMLQVAYDNRDNLERLYFIVWHAGKMQWED